MIEIIVGIIVLILAIIGIAKLASGRRGGSESLDINGAVSMASNSKRALLTVLYKDPTRIAETLPYLQKAAQTSKGAISAIYKQTGATREKVDAAVQRRVAPGLDAADYLDDIPALANTATTVSRLYEAGKINLEQVKAYVLGEVKAQNDINKIHYALRHAAMD